MKLPWGGLQAEAIGAWDELAAPGARGGRDVDHQPRDPRDRVARADRPRAGVARPRRRDRGAPGPLGPRPGPPDPRRVAGERQAPRRARLRRLPRPDPGPRAGDRIGAWFWGVQEIPDILDRWGQDLPPEQVHLVTVPPPGGAPELLWKRFSQAFGLDGIDLDLEAERHNPSLGVPETTPAAPDQPAGQRRARARRLPAAGPRAARPPDPVAAHPVAAARAAARPAPVGAGGVGVVDRRGPAARVRRGRRPRRPRRSAAGRGRTPTPTTRASGRSPRPRVDAITALLLDNARLRHEEERLRGRARRRPGRAGAGLRDAVVPAASLASCSGWRAAASVSGLLGVYRRARGRSSRSA